MDLFDEPIMIGVAAVAVIVVLMLVVKAFRAKGGEDAEIDELEMLAAMGKPQRKSGVKAVGTIERVERTGTSVAGNVRVYKLHMLATTEDGSEHRGVTELPIEEQDLGDASVGNLLPVIVDPANPSIMHFVNDSDAEEFSHILHKSRIARGLSEPLSPELERYGVTTEGVFSKIEPTGKILHGEVQVFYEVKVTDGSGTPITLSKTSFFPERTLKNIHVGTVIPVVKYLPEDHSTFTIEAPINP